MPGYFDSAFIAKFYLDEPESEAVRDLAASLSRVSCLLLGRMEVAAVFHRKWREGSFSEMAFREVGAQFAQDCAQGLWTWLPLTPSLVDAATARLAHLPKTVFLRSADALHLICASEHGFREIFSNDRHLGLAASHFKLKVRGITKRPVPTAEQVRVALKRAHS